MLVRALVLPPFASGLSSYAGGVFSGSPLMLAVAALCDMLPGNIRMLGATLLFTAFDLVSALLLRAICTRNANVESSTWYARSASVHSSARLLASGTRDSSVLSTSSDRSNEIRFTISKMRRCVDAPGKPSWKSGLMKTLSPWGTSRLLLPIHHFLTQSGQCEANPPR